MEFLGPERSEGKSDQYPNCSRDPLPKQEWAWLRERRRGSGVEQDCCCAEGGDDEWVCVGGRGEGGEEVEEQCCEGEAGKGSEEGEEGREEGWREGVCVGAVAEEVCEGKREEVQAGAGEEGVQVVVYVEGAREG